MVAYWFKICIAQSNCYGGFDVQGVRWAALHVDDNDELDARVGQPAVHGQALVDCLEQAEVLVDGLVREACFKDVQA